ncbi:MAG: hypothetical protein AB8G05_01175 [Oligoflexales bacterium]
MDKRYKKLLASIVVFMALNSCASTGSNGGNNQSSKPVNNAEGREYKKALLRCYKTGGSRIVKINGVLRCF